MRFSGQIRSPDKRTIFLWPRTMRMGGVALMAIFAIAVAAHAARGEFQAPLIVYAVATFFVTIHGRAGGSPERQAAA